MEDKDKKNENHEHHDKIKLTLSGLYDPEKEHQEEMEQMQKEEKRLNPFWKKAGIFLLDFTIDLLIVICAVVFLRVFIVSPFQINGGSMNHTFENSDFILVDQLTYNFQNPKRGDIVVFKPPHKENMVKETGFKCLSRKVYTKITNGETNDPCYVSEYFVKRIIGLPGDTVEIKEGEVYVKPRFAKEKIKLEEPYLDKEHQGHTCLTQSNSCVTTLDKKGIEYIVPENTYFVLGDNRGGSNDSRFWREDETSSRFVPFDNLSGKVRIVLFPFHSFGTIADPEMAKIDEELAKTLRVESENK